jgi:hypothetical protein
MADISLPESGLVLCLENTEDGCTLRIASLARPARLVRRVRLDWAEWCDGVVRMGEHFAADLERSTVPAASRRAVRDRLRALRQPLHLAPAPGGATRTPARRVRQGADAPADRHRGAPRARTAGTRRRPRRPSRLGTHLDLRGAGGLAPRRTCAPARTRAGPLRRGGPAGARHRRRGDRPPAAGRPVAGLPHRPRLGTGEGDASLDRRGGGPGAPLPRRLRGARGALGRVDPAAEPPPRGARQPFRGGARPPSPGDGSSSGADGGAATEGGARGPGGASAPARGQHPAPAVPPGGARSGARRGRARHAGLDRGERRPPLRPGNGRPRMGRKLRLHRPTPRRAAATDGRALGASRDRLYGYGPQDAEPRWFQPNDGAALDPVAISAEQLLLFGVERRGVRAVDALTGRERWSFLPRGPAASTSGSRASPCSPPRVGRAHRTRPPRRHGAVPGGGALAVHRPAGGLGAGGAGPARAGGSVGPARARPRARRGALAHRAPLSTGGPADRRGRAGVDRRPPRGPPHPRLRGRARTAALAACRSGTGAAGGRAPRRGGAGGGGHHRSGGPGPARRKVGVARGRRGRGGGGCATGARAGGGARRRPGRPRARRSTRAGTGRASRRPRRARHGGQPRLDLALLDESGDLALHRLASHFAVI